MEIKLEVIPKRLVATSFAIKIKNPPWRRIRRLSIRAQDPTGGPGIGKGSYPQAA
jgi:hypothetical protein